MVAWLHLECVWADSCSVVLQSGQETINIPAAYTVTYNAGTTTKNQNMVAMRVVFPADSGIKPNPYTSAICMGMSFGTFTSFQPSCETSINSNSQPQLLIRDLIRGKTTYVAQVMIGLMNSNVGKTVNNIFCEACSDFSCTSTIAFFGGIRLTYKPLIVSDVVEISSSENTNGARNSTLKISFRTTSEVVIDPTIYIRMPKSNSKYLGKGTSVGYSMIYNLESNGPYNIMVQQGSLASSARSGVAIKKIEITKDPEPGFDDILLYLGTSSIIPINYIIDILITPVLNPPSLNPVGGFEIRTGDSQQNWIDIAQSGVSFQTNMAGSFRNFSEGANEYFSNIQVVDKKTQVSASPVDYQFTLYVNNDVPIGSEIYVQFPSTWPLDCSAKATKPGITCIQGCGFTSSDNIVCDSITNSYKLLKGFDTIFSYVYTPGPIIFKLTGLTNPPTTASRAFTVTTYNVDGNMYPIDRSNNLFQLAFTPGQISINAIRANLLEINLKEGTWQIQFTAQHNIEPGYLIRLKFPVELGVQQLAKCTVTAISPAISPFYACKGDGAFNQIVITNLYASTIKGGTMVSFQINGISNPPDFVDPGIATFSIEDPVGGGNIDLGSYQFGTNMFLKSYIDNFQVRALNLTNGLFPVRYSFTLQPKGRVAKGAIIEIEMPPEIKPSDAKLMQSSCLTNRAFDNGFSFIQFSCIYIEANNTIQIRDGFKFDGSTYDPPTLNWYIDYITNPRGLITSGMFNVTIFNQAFRVLFQNINPIGPNVTMTGMPGAKSVEIFRSNYTNSQQYDLTLKIKATNYIELFDLLNLTLPLPVYFSNTTQCRGDNYWAKGPLVCKISDDFRNVQLNMSINGRYNPYPRRLKEDCYDDGCDVFDAESEHLVPKHGRRLIEHFIPGNTEMLLTFTNIISSVSTRPTTGVFTYNLTSNKAAPLEYSQTNLTFKNLYPSRMNSKLVGVQPNLWDKGRLANYTLVFSPFGFEINMYLEVFIDNRITIPEEFNKDKQSCLGIRGTDRLQISCKADIASNKITLFDLFESKETKPDVVEIIFKHLRNPVKNVQLNSWKLRTYTWDNYPIDVLDSGLDINFYCEFPCHTCNITRNEICFECYGPAVTSWIYFWDQKCLDRCPNGMYETYNNITVDGPKIFTCNFCESPCKTCGENKTDCLACNDNYLWYDVNHTCYEEFTWYFPFLIICVLLVLFTWTADCLFKETNTLYSVLYFLSLLEDATIAYYLYLFALGKVPGDRSLALTSFAFQGVLNIAFIFIHLRGIQGQPSPQYKQVRRDFKCTYWCCNLLAYAFNFKMSLILISYFFGRVRFAGRFTSDNWQKFNTFSILYMVSVYTTFFIDFYNFFMEYGTRHVMSYIKMELVIIQSLICIGLLMVIMDHCTCGGMVQKDLAKRAGIRRKTKKQKRKAHRSGMGNDESSYGSEDSDDDEDVEGHYEQQLARWNAYRDNRDQAGDDEEEDQPIGINARKDQTLNDLTVNEQSLDEKPDEIQDQSQIEMIKKSPRPTPEELAEQEKKSRELEQLAREMKEERGRLELQRQEQLRKDQEMLRLQEEIQKMKDEQPDLEQVVKNELQEKLGEYDGNPHRTPLGHWIVNNPMPVFKKIEKVREIEGDEEYWLQNSAIRGNVSNRSKVIERDASQIHFVQNEDAARGDDISQGYKSKMGTDKEFLDNQSAMYSNNDHTKSANSVFGLDHQPFGRNASMDLELMAGKSADYGDVSMKGEKYETSRKHEQIVEKSAEFGDASSFGRLYQASQAKENMNMEQNSAEYDLASGVGYTISKRDSFQVPQPVVDNDGHSDESSEGVVANHDPFNGINDAITKISANPGQRPLSASDDEEFIGGIQGSGRRKVKQVLYSDKSESSVDDMMEDTPSNYNIANGRLEGKSMGLKAIILYAKHQGIHLGEQTQPLPRIQEAADSSGDEGVHWKAMNNPLNDVGHTQIVGNNRTIEEGSRRAGSKKPDVQKQFLDEKGMMTPLKKNNFI